MTPAELNAWLHAQADAFPGKCAFLVADSLTDEPLHQRNAETVFPSASLIKTPILLAALEQVRQGILALDDKLEVPESAILPDSRVFDHGPDRYTLEELLHWMIVNSDNTATNVLLDTLGFDTVNEYAVQSLGLKHTLCQRKMLDFAAAQKGLDNTTSVSDQRRIFCLLRGNCVLNPNLRRLALSILCRQRDQGAAMRYVWREMLFAHKTGGLDGVSHDCGIVLSGDRPLFLGICTWDGPSPDGDPGQERFIGKLAKEIFQTYQV